MAEELKACRNCGGKCDPTGWMRGDGRQGPECEGCGITAPDVESWSRLMGGQDTSQGGEAVAWRVTGRDGLTVTAQYPEWAEADCLLTITPLYTHPADQAGSLVVSRELIENIKWAFENKDANPDPFLDDLYALLAKP